MVRVAHQKRGSENTAALSRSSLTAVSLMTWIWRTGQRKVPCFQLFNLGSTVLPKMPSDMFIRLKGFFAFFVWHGLADEANRSLNFLIQSHREANGSFDFC